MPKPDRTFNALTDRVARKDWHEHIPATTFDEAIEFAQERARRTGFRQFLMQSSRNGWWHCYRIDMLNLQSREVSDANSLSDAGV